MTQGKWERGGREKEEEEKAGSDGRREEEQMEIGKEGRKITMNSNNLRQKLRDLIDKRVLTKGRLAPT